LARRTLHHKHKLTLELRIAYTPTGHTATTTISTASVTLES
jgi:hypothetical protein